MTGLLEDVEKVKRRYVQLKHSGGTGEVRKPKNKKLVILRKIG
jgi:hypothetical protein